MPTLDDETGDDGDIVFRDLILLMLTGFVTVAVLMLAHINPKAAAARAKDTAPPGNVLVEANWPPEMDSDVDLWVQAPGDVPVGYSNKGGAVFNLLRDDLGHQLDLSGLNYESSYSRGIVPASTRSTSTSTATGPVQPPVPVTVIVSSKRDAQDPARQILMSKVELDREGQERTVFRFRLTEGGEVVAGQRQQPAAATPLGGQVMTDLPFLFAVAALLAAVLASIAIWAPRRLAVQRRRGRLLRAVHAGGLCRLQRPAQPAQAGGAGMVAGQGRGGDRSWAPDAEGRTASIVWLQLDGDRRAARLPPALEPADGPAAAAGARGGAAQRHRGPDAAAVRADPGPPRAQVLRPAPAGAAAQGPGPAAGADLPAARPERLRRRFSLLSLTLS